LSPTRCRLARAEPSLSASRLIDLERRRLPGRHDLGHLQAFHRRILGDVYDWAGQLRTVSIAKGSVFCLPQHLESYAADVFGRLGFAGTVVRLGASRVAVWLGRRPDRGDRVGSAAGPAGKGRRRAPRRAYGPSVV